MLKSNESVVRIFPAAFCVLLSLLISACSDHSESKNDGKSTPPSLSEKKPDAGVEKESAESGATPDQDQVGEDCVAFLRATRVVKPKGENKECPECPGGTSDFEVLQFNGFKIEKISPSEAGCEVTVEIRAEFNPGPGGHIVGGLIAWIPPAQREQYAQGKTPAGTQLYQVKVIYRRTDGFWRAIEFDQAGKE